MKKSLFIFSVIITLVVIGACKKDDPVIEKDDEPTCGYAADFTPELEGAISDYGLIPINLVNYWIYADTNWINDSTYSLTSIDTVHAYSPRKTDDDYNDLWFLLDGPWPTGTIHQADEQVYTLETGLLGCKYKALAFFEAETDTTFNSERSIGDSASLRKVYKSSATISTPAGDFDDCTVFKHNNSTEYQILKPGIGFVKFAMAGYETSYKEYTLIDYYIE